MRAAIYTCITGGFDSLKPPEFRTRGVDYICFSDRKLKAKGWEVRPVDSLHLGDRRAARRHKVLSHHYLAEYTHVVWVDGSFVLHGNMRAALALLLAGHHIAVRHHPWRKPSCVYAEARACLAQRKDDKKLITEQMGRYRAAGYPPGNGMVDTGFLLRRHSPETLVFNEAWWAQLAGGSLRDQLSFNFTSWSTGVPFRLIRDSRSRSDKWVRYRGHGNK